MSAKCLHGLYTQFCARCTPKTVTAVRVLRDSRVGSRGLNSSPFLDYKFSTNRELVVNANVEGGWRSRRRTACFVERTVIDSLDDRRIVFDVRVFPRPSVPDHDWIPTLQSTLLRPSGGVPISGMSYPDEDLGRQPLMFVLPLIGEDDGFNPEIRWRRTDAGRLFAYWSQRGLAAEWHHRDMSSQGIAIHRPNSHIDVQVWVWVQPRPFVLPISREWAKRFFPGGLPSLGKKRPPELRSRLESEGRAYDLTCPWPSPGSRWRLEMSLSAARESKQTQRRCQGCGARLALFRYRGVVKADRDHTLCFERFRAERNRRRAHLLAGVSPARLVVSAFSTAACHELPNAARRESMSPLSATSEEIYDLSYCRVARRVV